MENTPGYTRDFRIRLSKTVASMTRLDPLLLTPGGDDRIRTGDPLLAKQVLSQLSYIPADKSGGPSWDRTRDLALIKRAL